MKWVVRLLLLLGTLGVFSAITGIQHANYSNSGWSISHHNAFGRAAALCFGILALTAAFGCAKRRMFGWYSVAALLWAVFVGEVAYAIYATFTWDLPLPAIALGLLGEGAKIGFVAWLLFRLWPQQRPAFKNA